MRLRLESNYRDWYDHAFAKTGALFRRFDNAGMSRREMLCFLEGLGLHVPLHGIVSDIAPQLLGEFQEELRVAASERLVHVVVYLDELAHAGEGKIKVSAAEALRSYRDLYCTEYLAVTQTGIGESLRYLQVGQRKWWLRTWSETDWRSNCGEGDTEVLGEEVFGYHPRIEEPMFAVDFLKIGGHLYAIDFNIAPGLGPLRGVISATEVLELLQEAVERQEGRAGMKPAKQTE